MAVSVVSLTFAPKTILRKCRGCGSEFLPERPNQFRCRESCSRRQPAKPVTFVGVDGESVDGKYVLLGVGDEQIENPEGLSWKECFGFLYREFERRPKGTAFIGFYLGYDFTQILATLPQERAWYLLSREGQAKRRHRIAGKEPHPVEYDGWQFDLLANKRLRIRPKRCTCVNATCKCGGKASWLYVCDVGGFWQTSFLNVIDPRQWPDGFIDADDYARIEQNKAQRGSLKLDDETRYYNRLENRYLAKCMEQICVGFEGVGLHLTAKQWFGPGQAAQAWLKRYAPKREVWEAAVPEWFIDAARCCYYGGWFEVFAHGYIEGVTWEYDINSAYPSVIAKLPCLLHGKWHRGKGMPSRERRQDSICIVLGEFQSPYPPGDSNFRRNYSGPVPYRDSKGNISRPAIVSGWYYWQEVEASYRAGLCRKVRPTDIQEWMSYEACECEPPFAEIAELYEDRLRVGKDTVHGKSSKLVYNSAYGKFAQSIGDPMFGNAIYASLITMGCRRIVLEAIATHPEKARAVLMVATDAVFFRSPHPGLELSSRLGQWDCKKRRNLTIFKPGVYWDDTTRSQIRDATKPKFKARGINAGAFAKELWKVDARFRSEWRVGERNQWPDVYYYTDFSIVSATQALAWGKWDLAGSERESDTIQSSDPSSKRGELYYDSVERLWRTEIKVPEFDYENMAYNSHSQPYQKRFGTEDPFSFESREALGITQDGTVSEMFRGLLRDDE